MLRTYGIGAEENNKLMQGGSQIPPYIREQREILKKYADQSSKIAEWFTKNDPEIVEKQAQLGRLMTAKNEELDYLKIMTFMKRFDFSQLNPTLGTGTASTLGEVLSYQTDPAVKEMMRMNEKLDKINFGIRQLHYKGMMD